MDTTTEASNETNTRPAFRGVWQVLRFNAYRYVGAIALVALAVATMWILPLPVIARLAIAILTGLVVFWSAAALVVSHVVYDRSRLMRWGWLAEFLPIDARPPRWVNIHSGFDDTSKSLRRVFAAPPLQVIDIFDSRIMTERSLAAARKETDRDGRTVRATSSKISLPDASVDVACLLLAAHEIRDRSTREQLFGELQRILRGGGRVLLVEHLRDVWNFAAFGPGAFHFYSLREWLRVAKRAGLALAHISRITPFVAVVVLEKSQ